MGNQNANKKFNEDFKKMVIDFYRSGSTVTDLSSEYGVFEVTIYKRIQKLSLIDFGRWTSVTPDDFAKLQKQMRCIQE